MGVDGELSLTLGNSIFYLLKVDHKPYSAVLVKKFLHPIKRRLTGPKLFSENFLTKVTLGPKYIVWLHIPALNPKSSNLSTHTYIIHSYIYTWFLETYR